MLLGGVLLHSMNVLMLATVLPTIVGELGGAAMISWPTTAFLASSIVAATCAGMLTAVAGARGTYCAGATTFGVGALLVSLAPTMGWIIVGRFVQGFGGGLLAAVAYVLVRSTFPQSVWSRAITLLSGIWSVSILVGPLAGGVFAHYGNWRGAFVAVAAIAGVLTLGAYRVLPATAADRRAAAPRVPAARVALICVAIAGTSSAAIVAAPLTKAGLIALAIVSLAAMLRLDRRATVPLLPSDAFSPNTPTGVGLWLVLLLCVTYSPLQIYVPVFLQRLHGLDPLAAGYAVAGASLGWTAAALMVAGVPEPWPNRLMSIGPASMGVGLLAVGVLTPRHPILLLFPAIVLVGAGIGICWAFVAQRVMTSAKPGDEAVAASSVATVQQWASRWVRHSPGWPPMPAASRPLPRASRRLRSGFRRALSSSLSPPAWQACACVSCDRLEAIPPRPAGRPSTGRHRGRCSGRWRLRPCRYSGQSTAC
ncbi:MAG: MFS transporter [Reyranellales bacterium]